MRFSLTTLLATLAVTLPLAHADDLYRLDAECEGKDLTTWYFRLAGDGTRWSARLSKMVGPINIRNPELSSVADQHFDRASLTRNFPDFGMFTVQVPVKKTADIPYETLSVMVAFEGEDGSIKTQAYLRPSNLSQEYQTVNCDARKAGPWLEFVRGHDLRLLGEPAPGAVCKILYVGLHDQPLDMGCSGTLIRPDVVLSAAHCDKLLKEYPDSFIQCPGMEPRKVKFRDSSPKFMTTVFSSDDVGLFFLEQPIHEVTPIPIASSMAETRDLLSRPESCRLYGYGRRSDGTYGKLGGAPLVPVTEWNGGSAYMKTMLDQGILSTDPEAFLRPGDSGGPVVCTGPDGVKKVVAAHSFTAPYDNTANSVLVATPSNLEWIRGKIGRR